MLESEQRDLTTSQLVICLGQIAAFLIDHVAVGVATGVFRLTHTTLQARVPLVKVWSLEILVASCTVACNHARVR